MRKGQYWGKNFWKEKILRKKLEEKTIARKKIEEGTVLKKKIQDKDSAEEWYWGKGNTEAENSKKRQFEGRK